MIRRLPPGPVHEVRPATPHGVIAAVLFGFCAVLLLLFVISLVRRRRR